MQKVHIMLNNVSSRCHHILFHYQNTDFVRKFRFRFTPCQYVNAYTIPGVINNSIPDQDGNYIICDLSVADN